MKQKSNGFILLVVLIFATLLLAGCDLLFMAKYFVKGKVLAGRDDFGERSGIAGAKIEVGRSAVYSGSNGEFHGWFTVSTAGQVRIKISRRGYREEYFGPFTPLRGGAIDLGNVFLTPEVADLAGAYGRIEVSSGYNRHNCPDNSLPLPFDVKVVPGAREVPPFAEYEPGVILVAFNAEDMTAQMVDNLHREAGTRFIERIEGLNVDVVSPKGGRTVEETIALYENLPGVRYAEPNYYVYALGAPMQLPNDQLYGYQWGLEKIDMPLAWNICRDAANVLVAVLDTGMVLHDDLFPDPYGNWGNIRWDLGKDIVDGDDEPFDTDSTTDEDNPSHGAHVAGIIGALTDNWEGVAGAAWQVGIVPVRVLGEGGLGAHAHVAEGIKYAADLGVDIINLSLGSREGSRTLEEACKYAYERGVTLIAAAGNNNGPVFYPAAYDEVIAVAAIGPDGQRAPYSNYGPQIDVAAPGGYRSPDENPAIDNYDNLILSTSGYYRSPTENYQNYYAMDGTSMAAPHVAGLAALMIANGTASDPYHIREALIKSAHLYPNPDDGLGYGIINASLALDNTVFHTLEVFAGRLEGNTIYVYSDTAYVDYPLEKNYGLRAIDPGYYNVFGWDDLNGNGLIDSGDWFCQSREVLFTAGANVRINLAIKNFSVCALSDGPIEVIDRRDTLAWPVEDEITETERADE